MVFESIQASLSSTAAMIIGFLPVLIGAIIILIIGWIVGRVGSGIFAKILRKANVDETVGKTDFGAVIESQGGL